VKNHINLTIRKGSIHLIDYLADGSRVHIVIEPKPTTEIPYRSPKGFDYPEELAQLVRWIKEANAKSIPVDKGFVRSHVNLSDMQINNLLSYGVRNQILVNLGSRKVPDWYVVAQNVRTAEVHKE
jgi:hypothetical protein